jgi:cytochrome c oxidase subunit II
MRSAGVGSAQKRLASVARVARSRPSILALVGFSVVLAGCAEDAPQDTFDPHGPAAETIDNLIMPIFAIAGVVFVIVAAAVGYCVLRFRDRPNRDDMPEQTHGKPALEIGLTIAPAVLLAVIGVFTVKTVFDLADEPDDALRIDVVGQQWWWEFTYPTLETDTGLPIVTSGEMVIPAGQPVALRLASRDVIHSFWIPALNGKRDAVPGRVQPLSMEADEPGEYWGQCAEFCGLSHANMRMRVIALSAEDWDRWVANQQRVAAEPTDEEARAGMEQFIGLCASCHQVNGLVDAEGEPIISNPAAQVVAGAVPNLTHLMSRTTFAGGSFDLKFPECTNDPEYDAQYVTGTADNCLNQARLEEWLRDPTALKPMFTDPENLSSTDGLYRGMPTLGLSEDQIDQLVAYLRTLK